jgi:hypothetical protein
MQEAPSPSSGGVDPNAAEEVAEDDSRFVCNVCIGNVRDPVVTLCGHLYW